MNFFRINLNKLGDPALERRRERRAAALWVFVAIVFVGLLAEAWRVDRRLGREIGRMRGAKADIEKRIASLENDSDFVGEDDVRALAETDRGRIFWTPKLVALSSLMGKDLALTGIEYDGQKLVLRGVARLLPGDNRFGLVSSFIDKLKLAPEFRRDFTKVDFQSSSRIEAGDQKVLGFEIICLPD